MRTKTLLLSAAAAVAGILSASAQVYSVNVVGYVNVPLPAGLTLVANPLNTTDNTLSNLVKTVPALSKAYKWTGLSYVSSTKTPTSWSPNLTLAPGEGAFVQVAGTTNVTFVGEVLQGSLSNAAPAGLTIQASKVPQGGDLVVLGLTNVVQLSKVYKWTGLTFVSSTKTPTSWSPLLSFGVGESFFLDNKGSAVDWVRNFTVQ